MSHDAVMDEYILNITRRHQIKEQSDLQKILKSKGYDIPQATLSRRLKKLNIAKIAGVYQVVDLPLSNVPVILNVQVSDFGLVILHTHPGNASSLAYFFDQKYIANQSSSAVSSGILGTIAGDDTILMIVKSKAHVEQVLEIIYKEFSYLP